ncbi:hypothetical protein [Telluribacter humicola]|uniref:hypothetical protein n=1 Tax=Telluribacter humicola TaxID=1720261 RepID=UPI001A96CB12|nr:hypothetical protein [Telluribacter humicola]
MELTTASPWLRIYGSVNTKSYEEDEQPTEHGSLYAVNASAFVPGDTEPIRQLLKAMQWHRWVVRVTDAMGVKRQAGTRSEGLDLVASFGISPEMSGERGYRIRLGGSLTERPVIVA